MVFVTSVTDWDRRLKRCPTCSEVKPFDEFGFQKGRGGGGIKSMCRSCYSRLQRERRAAAGEDGRRRAREAQRLWVANNREHRLTYERKRGWRRHFGLSPEDYDALLREQGGRCAICRLKPPPGQVLSVDHDHGTGKIRGLLCKPCNTGLALFKDRPLLLRGAALYLRRGARR